MTSANIFFVIKTKLHNTDDATSNKHCINHHFPLEK